MWEKVFSRLPLHMGCVLLVGPTERHDVGRKEQIKKIRRAIEKTNSICQLVSADEEVLSAAYSRPTHIFKRDGKLTAAGSEYWWRISRTHLCSVDPLQHVAQKPFKQRSHASQR